MDTSHRSQGRRILARRVNRKNIHIFDWMGGPVAHSTIDERVFPIAINDACRRLLAIWHDPTPAVLADVRRDTEVAGEVTRTNTEPRP